MTKYPPVIAQLSSRPPEEWNGSPVDLRDFRSLVLWVHEAPASARVLQVCPIDSPSEGHWIDWHLSRRYGAVSTSVLAAGVYQADASCFVRLKPDPNAGGTYYLGARS